MSWLWRALGVIAALGVAILAALGLRRRTAATQETVDVAAEAARRAREQAEAGAREAAAAEQAARAKALAAASAKVADADARAAEEVERARGQSLSDYLRSRDSGPAPRGAGGGTDP